MKAIEVTNVNNRSIIRRQWCLAAGIGLSVMAALSLTSCDNHPLEDVSWHSWQPGMVYCTNGHVTTYEQCMEDGNRPEAVIFYVDQTEEIEGIAYAVSLHDTYREAFSPADTIYAKQGTSADYATCDGETNTIAMRYANIPSPLVDMLPPKYFVPSVGESYRLFAAREVVNFTIGQCGGDLLPVSSEDCWYWTSTECEGAERDRAWRFSLFSGRFESEDKHTFLPVRPILMIRLNEKEL